MDFEEPKLKCTIANESVEDFQDSGNPFSRSLSWRIVKMEWTWMFKKNDILKCQDWAGALREATSVGRWPPCLVGCYMAYSFWPVSAAQVKWLLWLLGWSAPDVGMSIYVHISLCAFKCSGLGAVESWLGWQLAGWAAGWLSTSQAYTKAYGRGKLTPKPTGYPHSLFNVWPILSPTPWFSSLRTKYTWRCMNERLLGCITSVCFHTSI